MPMVYKWWKKPEYPERTTDHGQAYQSRDKKFPKPNGKGNLVSRLVFFANTPPKHDISV